MRMKKFVYFILVIIASVYVKAQDTLYMNDGTRLPVKLIEVGDDVVRYKNWSNQDGPTWVKQKNNIMKIKREKIILNEDDLNFSICEDGYLSAINIVKAIDSLYYNGIAHKDIPKYVNSLPKCVNRKELCKFYFRTFEQACDVGGENDIIRYGEIYLYIGCDKDLPYVVGTLAKIYAKNDNEAKANEIISLLERISKDNFDMFDDTIEQFKKDTYELLHPKRLEDEYSGSWVFMDNFNPTPMILKINDISKDTGSNIILQGEDLNLFNKNYPYKIHYGNLNVSQRVQFYPEIKLSVIQFASETVKDFTWLTSAAEAGYESARKTAAGIHAILNSSKDATWEQKLGYGFLTEVGFNAVSLLLDNMTNSSRTVEDYQLFLIAPEKKAMDAQIVHIKCTITNEGKVIGGNPENNFVRFYSWEDSDSVFFISSNAKPIMLTTNEDNSYLINEYKHFKWRYSFWNPRYLIPFLVGEAAGAYLFAYAITNSKGKVVGPVIGTSVLIFGSFFYANVIRYISKINKIKVLNRQSYEKLKQKSAADFSFTPLYNPMDNTIGASVNLKF